MRIAVGTKGGAGSLTLPAWDARAITVQAALLAAAAWALPALAHAAGFPVRQILPMHWPVLLGGLVYGWRAGLLLGLLAPGTSFLLSGMPAPHILPAMTVELAAYGFLAGFARQTLQWNPFFSAGLALVGGRVLFLGMAAVSGAAVPTFPAYVARAIVPGLTAALGQWILLPIVSSLWVRLESGVRAEVP
jgi:niacin transporter